MATATSISIAIIGTGLIGPRHAKSVLACPEATLLCLVDPRSEAATIATELGVPLFTSVEHMLQHNYKPDAAIVCTPNSTHVAVSESLLNAEIHVLVEKPISTDLESGTHLIEAARKADKHLLVGHHRRFNPYVTATKRALEDNAVGRVIAVSGLWATYKPDSYFQAPMEWHAQRGAGGPILINLVHDVDILQYLLGPIVRVHAEQTLSQRGHEAEEGAAVLLKFASGVVGTFIVCDASPSPHTFEQGTGENPLFPQAGKDFYRILGSEGTLSVGDMKLSRYEGAEGKTWTSSLREDSIVVGQKVPFDEQVMNFVQVIQGAAEPRCAGRDGLQALTVCDAVKRAMNTGKPIDINIKR